MAYGNGDNTCQSRMVELGSLSLAADAPLAELRRRVIDARRQLMEAGWPADPTRELDGKHLDGLLLARQAEVTEAGLNSKWAEKARIQVSSAIKEQCARSRRCFAGRIAHLDGRDDVGEPTSLPESLLERLDAVAVARLKADLAAKGGTDALLDEALGALGALALVAPSEVPLLDDDDAAVACLALPPRAAALAWLRGHVLGRYGRPEMDAPDRDGAVRQTVQLHLDKDCLRPAKTEYASLLRRLSDAAPQVLRDGRAACFDLPLTSVSARGDTIPLQVALAPQPLLHLLVAEARQLKDLAPERAAEALATVAQELRFRSLCLEIGPASARITAVVARAEPANAGLVRAAAESEKKAAKALERARAAADEEKLAKAQAAHAAAQVRLEGRRAAFAAVVAACRAVIGVDPGQRDAIAAVALRVPAGEALDPARLMLLGSLGREPMRDFLSSHALAEPERAAPAMMESNAPFLALADDIAAAIDAASSAIDTRYRRIARLKGRLNRLIGRKANEFLPEDAAELPLAALGREARDAALCAHRALFRELARVRQRKAARLALWARLRGAKRSWFGMLANRLAVSALALGAGVALEDGDWGIEERGTKEYKGRNRNRVMASVAPRKLLDTVKARLDWSGVVWWTVTSWHTSKTDHRVAVVDARQRPNGSKTFTALCDGMKMDADEHAGETLAATAMLRPIGGVADRGQSECDEAIL